MMPSGKASADVASAAFGQGATAWVLTHTAAGVRQDSGGEPSHERLTRPILSGRAANLVARPRRLDFHVVREPFQHIAFTASRPDAARRH